MPIQNNSTPKYSMLLRGASIHLGFLIPLSILVFNPLGGSHDETVKAGLSFKRVELHTVKR